MPLQKPQCLSTTTWILWSSSHTHTLTQSWEYNEASSAQRGVKWSEAERSREDQQVVKEECHCGWMTKAFSSHHQLNQGQSRETSSQEAILKRLSFSTAARSFLFQPLIHTHILGFMECNGQAPHTQTLSSVFCMSTYTHCHSYINRSLNDRLSLHNILNTIYHI